ncbi:MAG: 30S ribosomal protein S20 [Nitrospinae bacterium]|nr:30S ribosomal protein S20 [Nitrospinota bacterium]
MAVVHKSTIQRARQNLKRRARNQRAISRMKTESKKVMEAIGAGDPEGARAALNVAVPVIAKAAGKGILNRRTASRKVSRLTKRVNELETKSAT